MKRVFAFITILSVLAFSLNAQDNKASQANKHPKQENKKKLKKELNLTDHQSAELKKAKRSIKKEKEAVKNDATLSKEQKKEKLKAVKNSRKQKMQSILTTEQQAKMAKLRKAHPHKKHQKRK